MTQSGEIYLLRFTGDDRPGLTATITAALGVLGADVLDINQAVIHQSLLLGIMVRLPTGLEGVPASVQQAAESLDLRMKVKAIDADAYDQWVQRQGKERNILTLLARTVTAEQLAAVSRVVADQGLNIDVIHRLSGRPARRDVGEPKRACLEFSLRGTPLDADQMHKQFMKLSTQLSLDLAWQEDDVYRRSRRMVVFDMDSTLIQAEVIDELAKEAGMGERVAAITEQAMRGEIDFDHSLTERVATLQGLPESTLQKVADRLQLTEGAEILIANLKAFGYRTAILSGGFTFFGRVLQRRLGIDHLHANELEIRNGLLTGRVLGPIINGPRKAELLEQIAAEAGINRRQVIAIGDGANDLPMLNRAGLGIAFHAKPIVRQRAGHAVSTLGLDAVLYLLGVRDRQRMKLPAQWRPEHQVTGS